MIVKKAPNVLESTTVLYIRDSTLSLNYWQVITYSHNKISKNYSKATLIFILIHLQHLIVYFKSRYTINNSSKLKLMLLFELVRKVFCYEL